MPPFFVVYVKMIVYVFVSGNSNGFPIVEGFGSSVMGMFSVESDLDLSINFTNDAAEIPRFKKIQTLRKLARKLYFFQSNFSTLIHLFSFLSLTNDLNISHILCSLLRYCLLPVCISCM